MEIDRRTEIARDCVNRNIDDAELSESTLGDTEVGVDGMISGVKG